MRMRQKVSISQLPIRLGIFLLLYLVPQSLSAQENNDSTHILRNGASITPDDVLKRPTLTCFQKRALHILYIHPDSWSIYPAFHSKGIFPYLIRPILPYSSEVITARAGYCINSIMEHCSVPEARQVWQASGVSTVLH